MTTALLFPGQGTDLAESAAAWRAGSAHVRGLLDVAADAVGTRPGALLGPTALARTEFVQPVLAALGVGIVRELRDRGVVPDVVAGHSAGEVAACAAAGAIGGEQAVRLAATRGRLMAREAARRPGAMVSVRGSADRVAALVAARPDGLHVGIAARNAPDEWVLSGDAEALRAIVAGEGATPLSTAGAWHSPAMAGAHDEYERALAEASRTPIEVPLVCNHTGGVVRSAAELPRLLAAQLTHPVRWTESMESLAAMGVRRVIACGPARALLRFARAALPGIETVDLSVPERLANLAPLVAR